VSSPPPPFSVLPTGLPEEFDSTKPLGGCGCLTGLVSIFIVFFTWYEIWSWMQTIICTIIGTYC
jgi:hypothetical protein